MNVQVRASLVSGKYYVNADGKLWAVWMTNGRIAFMRRDGMTFSPSSFLPEFVNAITTACIEHKRTAAPKDVLATATAQRIITLVAVTVDGKQYEAGLVNGKLRGVATKRSFPCRDVSSYSNAFVQKLSNAVALAMAK